jgi:hypothetical protein
VFGLINKFNHKAELRESKDEMLIGELVRAMARQGYPAIRFRADADLQRVTFKTVGDPILTNVYLTLDRKTGTGAISAALVGSKATLTIAAEVKNYVSDPDDLIQMLRTDFANLLKMPFFGGVRLNHELNSVFATAAFVIDIDDYVMKGDQGAQGLVQFLHQKIAELREHLRPYKKPST